MVKTLDELSKEKAYLLFDSGAIATIEVGTTKGLCQIHSSGIGSSALRIYGN